MATPIKVRIKVADTAKLRALSSGEFQQGTFFIASPQKVPPGSRIDIALLLPDKTTNVDVSGVVEPTDRAGILVRLDDAPRVVHAVDAYLRTTDSIERRESARVDAMVKIRLKFADAAQFEETYTKEVSLGGLFVATPKPVDIGTTVEVIFLVGATTFSIAGTVAHHQPRSGTPGMGIRLAPLSVDVRTQFESLVQSAAIASVANDARRQSPRIATRAAIKLRPTTARRFDEMCLKDISRGGTFVAATKTYPVGSSLSVVLVHPITATEVRVSSRVIRAVSVDEARVTGTEAGMGIQFDSLTPEARATIDELMANAIGVEPSAATSPIAHPPRELTPAPAAVTPPPHADRSASGPPPLPPPLPSGAPAPKGAERRTAPRLESRTRVMLSFGSADELREMYTRDISKGGAFIVTDDPPPAMAQVEITVVPPGAAGISLLADVVHSVPKSAITNPNDTPGMGVRFRNLTPEKRAILEDYLRALAAEPTPPPQVSTLAAERMLPPLKPLVGAVAGEDTATKSPQQKRAEEFFGLAQECLLRGDREGALRNIQLATSFDPTENRFRTLLKNIRNR